MGRVVVWGQQSDALPYVVACRELLFQVRRWAG